MYFYCQNDAEHINTLGGHTAVLAVLNLTLHAKSLGCKELLNVQQTITVVMYDFKLQDTA